MRVFWICLFLVGCQPTTKEDFQSEGRDWMQSVYDELKQVHTKEDIQKKLPFLTKKFSQLADLIVQIRKNQDWSGVEDENEESKKLRQELERVYCIPGGKDIIELSQIKALQKLDRWQR